MYVHLTNLIVTHPSLKTKRMCRFFVLRMSLPWSKLRDVRCLNRQTRLITSLELQVGERCPPPTRSRSTIRSCSGYDSGGYARELQREEVHNKRVDAYTRSRLVLVLLTLMLPLHAIPVNRRQVDTYDRVLTVHTCRYF